MPKWRAMSRRSAEAALRVSAGLRAGFRCEWQIAYWRFAEAGLCEVTGVADMPFDIRRYKPGDLAGLIALFRDTVRRINRRDYSHQQVMAWAPDEIDAQQWTRRFDNKAVWVADLNGVPVGFVDVARDGQIDMLYVHADHQGSGVASRLLRTVEASAAKRGLLRLFTEASITARPFFEHRGFRVIATQRVVRWAQEFVNYRMDKRLGDGAGTSEAAAAREPTGPGLGEPGDKLRSRA
jgi:putative acetyltransferase